MIKLRQRLSSTEGFTLIELLIVIVIIGILLAIAVPSYLGFRDRAQRRASQSDLRAAIPSAEAWYSDHGSYSTMSVVKLKTIDAGLASVVSVNNVTNSGYCLQAPLGNKLYAVHGPGATWYSGGTGNCASGSVIQVGN